MYEGKPVGTPDAGAFWRVIAQHDVKALFTAPTAMRAIKQAGPDGKLLQQLRSVEVRGRCSSPASAATRRPPSGRRRCSSMPVIDHWWQTETGWAIAGYPSVSACSRSSPARRPALPGYDLHALDDDGQELRAPARRATSCVRLPLPPGCAPTLWQNDEGIREAYLARIPRLVPHRRRRLDRRGRRRLGHGPHRRHHQRRRPPACRPARWRKCSPRIPMSPNAR